MKLFHTFFFFLSLKSLFTSFNEDHIFNKGTFKSFLPLCGYYEVMQGVSENDTSNYLEQVQTYLDDVMDTRVMTIATRHLKDAGEMYIGLCTRYS